MPNFDEPRGTGTAAVGLDPPRAIDARPPPQRAPTRALRGAQVHPPPVVALVGDCAGHSLALDRGLGAERFQVRTFQVQTTVDQIAALRPDLVIHHLDLPGRDGLQVLSGLKRTDPGIPVLTLTTRGMNLDHLVGLRLGADDCVAVPFGIPEVIVRIEAILRRAGRHPGFQFGAGILRFGAVEIDRAARIVRKNGVEVGLAPRSFDLLVALCERKGSVATRHELLLEVWGYPGGVATRTVDAHIMKIRSKLEEVPSDPRRIVTVPKVGYRLVR